MLKLNGKSMSHQKDKAYMEWLQSIGSINYQRNCQNSFLSFLEFLKEQGWEKPSGDMLLAKHKANRKSDDNKTKYEIDDLIPKFIQWLKEQRGLKHNSAINTSVPIRGFFNFHREPLRVQKSSFTAYKETVKRFHIFTQEELQKMVRVGDLEEKAILLLGKDLGVRVGDFIRLKRSPILEAIKNQNGEFPIEFQIETEKEGVVAIGHVMQETWEVLKDLWANTPQSEYMFPSNSSHISEDRANYVIKDTWNQAYPDRTNVSVRFHELRSFKMTALSDAGVTEWSIKKLVGKKLGADVSPYLKGVNLKEEFKKAEPRLQLTGVSRNHVKLEELEAKFTDQNRLIADQALTLDALKQDIAETRKEIDLIAERVPEPERTALKKAIRIQRSTKAPTTGKPRDVKSAERSS